MSQVDIIGNNFIQSFDLKEQIEIDKLKEEAEEQKRIDEQIRKALKKGISKDENPTETL